MGDRANVQIIDDEEHSVFLYTHWDAHSLLEIVSDALRRGGERWNDAQYLARIVFCEMIEGDVMGTTGFGITARVWDNDHPIIVLNPQDQTVRIEDKVWTFEEFAMLDEPCWP